MHIVYTKDHLDDLSIDGDSIQIDPGELRWRWMDWIHLDQDRGQWRALVDVVMKLRGP
jgi:hypothetical protein